MEEVKVSRCCDLILFSLALSCKRIPLMNALWAFQRVALLEVVPLFSLKNSSRRSCM